MDRVVAKRADLLPMQPDDLGWSFVQGYVKGEDRASVRTMRAFIKAVDDWQKILDHGDKDVKPEPPTDGKTEQTAWEVANELVDLGKNIADLYVDDELYVRKDRWCGWCDGHDTGYNQGYAEGWQVGVAKGTQDGLETGRKQGEVLGWRRGYNAHSAPPWRRPPTGRPTANTAGTTDPPTSDGES